MFSPTPKKSHIITITSLTLTRRKKDGPSSSEFQNPRSSLARALQDRVTRLSLAVAAIGSGKLYREVTAMYGLPISSIWYRVNKTMKKPSRRRSLTDKQKKLIVDTPNLLAVNEMPVTDTNLREDIKTVMEKISPAQKHSIQLKPNTISKTFLRSFRRRHRHALRFARPLRREAARFKAVNFDPMTQHFQKLEQLIDEHDLTPDCIFNLGECGVSPEK